MCQKVEKEVKVVWENVVEEKSLGESSVNGDDGDNDDDAVSSVYYDINVGGTDVHDELLAIIQLM